MGKTNASVTKANEADAEQATSAAPAKTSYFIPGNESRPSVTVEASSSEEAAEIANKKTE